MIEARNSFGIQLKARQAIQIAMVGITLPERDHAAIERLPGLVIAASVSRIALFDEVARRRYARANSVFKMRWSADTHMSFSSGVPIVIRMHDGSPKDFKGRTMTPSRKSMWKNSSACAGDANGTVRKFASVGSGCKPRPRSSAVSCRTPFALI